MAKVTTKKYKDHLLEELRDPAECVAYLNAALQDEDPQVFLLALKDIADAQGGLTWLAEATDLNRENLYRTLSLRGNPRFFNLQAILEACGLEISIQLKHEKTGS